MGMAVPVLDGEVSLGRASLGSQAFTASSPWPGQTHIFVPTVLFALEPGV